MVAVIGAVGLIAFGLREVNATLDRLNDDDRVPLPAVPCTVTGRLHDGEGLAVPAARLTFVDTTGTTGTHFLAHPRTLMISAHDAGVFRASLPFTTGGGRAARTAHARAGEPGELLDARAPEGPPSGDGAPRGQPREFCTTDDSGGCTLDADPGTEDLELRVGKRSVARVARVAVGSAPQQVVLSLDDS